MRIPLSRNRRDGRREEIGGSLMAWDVLVADYGMDQYYGGPFDLEERLEALRDVG